MLSFLFGVKEYFESATIILVIIISLAGIVFTIGFSMIVIKKINGYAAIFISSFICCLLMFPLLSAFNNYMQKKITGNIIDEAKAEIKFQRSRADRLKSENKIRELERDKLNNEVLIARQSIEIEHLNTSNILLERARLQMQGFQQIAELALTQANFKYNLIRQEPTTPIKDSFWKIKADFYYDEVLVVTSYDLNAKFGIDLKDVKVTKSSDGSVNVSGIRPKFIGMDRYKRDPIISEIRRVDYKYGVRYRQRILDDKQYLLLADNKATQFDIEFHNRIINGFELAFMDDVIIQLAQNFIKIVLAPIFENIEFDNIDRPAALSLMDFLANELKENNEKRYNLLGINEQIIFNLDLLEKQTAGIMEELVSLEAAE